MVWWGFLYCERKWQAITEDCDGVPTSPFSPNWKYMNLMGWLFDGWGTGCMFVPREWWSVAQCLDKDQWPVVSLRNQCWEQCCLISSSVTSAVGPSTPSVSLIWVKAFLMVRAVKIWSRLPREVVDTLALKTTKVRLGGSLSNLIEL